MTQPAWRSARATDAADPWAALAAVTDVGLPAGVSLTGSGGVSVAGLEWLGARVYDPAARGFLSVDPLSPILGAAWSGNPYSYAGNDPLQAVDPLGLRPATDADMQAYRDANQGIFDGGWWEDNWEYVAAGAVIALGVGLMFTGVGGPAGVALMMASGAMVSGGVEVISQKQETGRVDWGKVAIQGGIGAASGLAGGVAAAGLSKAASAASRAVTPWINNVGSRVLSDAGQAAISSGASGMTSNTLQYGTQTNWQGDASGYVASAATGFGTGLGGSWASSKASNLALSNIHIDPRFPTPNGSHVRIPRHAEAPNVLLVKKGVTAGVDHFVGGLQGGVNEWMRPGGDGPVQGFTNGLLSGAEGQTYSTPRRVAG